MNSPFRTRDLSGGTTPHVRRQHRSSSSASFRHTSQTTNGPPPAPRQADLHLDFIIIGGGIAGLSAAYSLAVSGHRVRVFEQARGLKHRPGGVRLPPSATRILSHWGVEKEVAQKASITPSSSILDMRTGRSIGQSTWKTGLIEEMGSSFYMMHHADLLEILLRLASSAGARVQFGVTVESVEPAREDPSQNSTTSTPNAEHSSRTLRPTVRLKTGEILHADVVIGADGQRSIVRRVVTDEDEEPDATPIGLSMFMGCVSMTEVRKYPPLKQLADVGWSAWIGDGRAVLGYPIRLHQEYAVHVWWEDRGGSSAVPRPGTFDSWDPTTPLASLRYKEAQMDPRLRFLLDKAGLVSRHPWIAIPPPEDWVDDSGSIMLIGEAAHPQGPGTSYGCSLALEDAAILGTLFSRLRSADQVPTLLYAYQDLRKERADMVTALEQQNMEVGLSNPPRIHDGLVRWTAIPADAPSPPPGVGPADSELAEIAEVWGYYAIDAAEEWWVEWGMLRERSQVKK